MATFQACFREENVLMACFGEVYEVAKDWDPFEGPYVVIPKVVDQTLPTKHKVMRDDVLVTEIPYAETTNIHGTTVTIAS